MKRLLFCLFLFSGCASTVHFSTPNDIYKEKVVLWLTDKSKIAGQITVSLEKNISLYSVTYPSFIEFIPEGASETKHINLNDIIGYSLGADFYALKQVETNLDGILHLLFVKRLTGEDSKLQLYELYESGRANPTGEAGYSYYLSLPSFVPLQTINTRSSSLVPYFDVKMSKIVADCPQLADKIQMKEPGYFLSMTLFNVKKQPEVLLRIINEYNNCK